MLIILMKPTFLFVIYFTEWLMQKLQRLLIYLFIFPFTEEAVYLAQLSKPKLL